MLVFLAAVAFAFWGAIFLLFWAANGKSASDLLLGPREAVPDELGLWREVSVSNWQNDLAKEQRQELVEPELQEVVGEERFLLQGTRLLRQRRLRHRHSREIVRVFPEQTVPRPRRRG